MASKRPAAKKESAAISFLKAGVIIVFAGFLLVAVFYLGAAFLERGNPLVPIACTLEARQCPDGSWVGRVEPDCEFQQCGTRIANPASVYCQKLGGSLDLASGNCALPGGASCDEWDLFRGDCDGYPAAAAGTNSCATDSDCAPAPVCHPSSCVNSTYAGIPDNMACTMACLGPLDCGAGYCGCVEGTCRVISAG